MARSALNARKQPLIEYQVEHQSQMSEKRSMYRIKISFSQRNSSNELGRGDFFLLGQVIFLPRVKVN